MAYVVVVYPLVLAGGQVLDNTLIPLLWIVAAAGLIAAGAVPLGRSRYLLPLSWVVTSLAYDALVAIEVFERPHDDWVPITFALGLLLPAGLILLYVGATLARVRESRRHQI